MRFDPNRGRPPEPLPGACLIVEEADLVARVPGHKREELERLDPESRLGDNYRDPDIPGRPQFRGIVRQAVEGGQRSQCLGIGTIHQHGGGWVFVQQADGFRDLCPAILVQELAGDDEQN